MSLLLNDANLCGNFNAVSTLICRPRPGLCSFREPRSKDTRLQVIITY